MPVISHTGHNIKKWSKSKAHYRTLYSMEMGRNWNEWVFACLHGDRTSSQPMIWQSKDKWIIMRLSLRIPTKCCTKRHAFVRVNECMKRLWNSPVTACAVYCKKSVLHCKKSCITSIKRFYVWMFLKYLILWFIWVSV